MSIGKLPQDDAQLEEALKALFKDWREAVSPRLRNNFIVDGAMTGYSEQKVKILFIGRELHSGTPNIVKHVVGILSPKQKARRKDKKTKSGSTSGRPCWGRALSVTYGLLRGVEKWDEIPDIDYFRKTFRTPEGVSFAIMEASKYKNREGPELSEHFENWVNESIGKNSKKKNFTRDEIEYLDPDLIISWNLRGAFKEDKKDKKGKKYKKGDCFLRKLTKSEKPRRVGGAKIWTYTFDERRDALTGKIKRIPLIDTWHLSAPNKESEGKIYTPIVKVAKTECKRVKEDIFDEREKNAAKIKNEGPNALPGYSIQKWKILFVDKGYKDKGLERTKRALSTKKNKLKLDVCSKRALRITYGLLHDVEKWDKIPNPNYFRTTFKTPEGISFAARDASVLKGGAIKPKPDLIITCNLEDLEESCGKSYKVFSEAACIGMGTYKGIPLIDAWKIVSKGKKIRDSYKSIRKAVKKLKG